MKVLADPEAIDAVIARVVESGADYGFNTPPHHTYPKGLDAEAMTVAALRTAAARAASGASEFFTADCNAA